MEVFECMRTRSSVKSYKSEQVPKELIDKIIEAGLSAPSGLNMQSPIILAVTNKQVRDEFSKLNAGKDPFFRADPFYNAPCVLIVLAKKDVPFRVYDGSLVMENMMLAAHEEGIGSCWVGVFSSDEVKAALDLPQELVVTALMPMGYPAADASPAPFHSEIRNREETVFEL